MHTLYQPRRAWFALLMSMVLPGFGQLYNGQANKAIYVFLSFALVLIPGLALVALYLPTGWVVPVGALATLLLWGYGMADAWRTARSQSAYTPPGHAFVLGDNRSTSHDTRQFGTVPLQDIVGKALQIWLSRSHEEGVRWERLGAVVR